MGYLCAHGVRGGSKTIEEVGTNDKKILSDVLRKKTGRRGGVNFML